MKLLRAGIECRPHQLPIGLFMTGIFLPTSVEVDSISLVQKILLSEDFEFIRCGNGGPIVSFEIPSRTESVVF